MLAGMQKFQIIAAHEPNTHIEQRMLHIGSGSVQAGIQVCFQYEKTLLLNNFTIFFSIVGCILQIHI